MYWLQQGMLNGHKIRVKGELCMISSALVRVARLPVIGAFVRGAASMEHMKCLSAKQTMSSYCTKKGFEAVCL